MGKGMRKLFQDGTPSSALSKLPPDIQVIVLRSLYEGEGLRNVEVYATLKKDVSTAYKTIPAKTKVRIVSAHYCELGFGVTDLLNSPTIIQIGYAGRKCDADTLTEYFHSINYKLEET